MVPKIDSNVTVSWHIIVLGCKRAVDALIQKVQSAIDASDCFFGSRKEEQVVEAIQKLKQQQVLLLEKEIKISNVLSRKALGQWKVLASPPKKQQNCEH